MTNGQIAREFAAKLEQCYPGLRAEYMPMAGKGWGHMQPQIDAGTVLSVVLSRKSATWTHTLSMFLDFGKCEILVNEMSYLTARPFETRHSRESETVDSVEDMHRVIRSYFA